MKSVIFFLLMLPLCASQLAAASSEGTNVVVEPFGSTREGEAVQMFTLSNSKGLTAKIITYGAIIYSMEVPDRDGKFANVTANRPTVADYQKKSAAFGAVVGRFANRIAGASFKIGDHVYNVTRNAGPNHIHGGARGFDKRVWKGEVLKRGKSAAVRLTYLSKDGEEGYPGNMECTLIYELTNENEFKMYYFATTDKPTVVNLSNHAYWNLAGAYSGDVLDQVLQVNAEQYLLADEALVPTGQFAPVEGTPVDFRKPRRIGERIGDIKEKQFNGGYDHCMVIKRSKPEELVLCATLKDTKSGRTMEVYTTQPGVQLYSANFASGAFEGPNGYSYPRHCGFCLETQHYPDSPNKPGFPSTLLPRGGSFAALTVHKFGVE